VRDCSGQLALPQAQALPLALLAQSQGRHLPLRLLLHHLWHQ
jgi:hypothetical protein